MLTHHHIQYDKVLAAKKKQGISELIMDFSEAHVSTKIALTVSKLNLKRNKSKPLDSSPKKHKMRSSVHETQQILWKFVHTCIKEGFKQTEDLISEFLPALFESDDQSLIRLFNRLKALNEEVSEFALSDEFKKYMKSQVDKPPESDKISKKSHEKEITKLK